jgi:hypothetical protein
MTKAREVERVDDDIGVYGHPALDTAIKAIRADGFDAHDAAHAMISAGIAHLGGNYCPEHVAEQLEWVRGWLNETIAEIRNGKVN